MAYKILYADDEENMEDVIRQRLRRRIRKGELEVVYAYNGRNALEQIKKHPDIAFLFTDINMPEMDGLELLSHICTDYPDIYTIVVSAYGDMANIRSAMNSGAYDFITKPIDFKDFEAVLAKVIGTHKEREKSRLLERDLSSIRHEMDYAGRLQSRVLPTNFPQHNDYEMFADATPARDVGGDFYDIFQLDNEHLGFLIADVSGKGISAAIFMAISRTIFHVTAHSLDEISADEIVTCANKMICKENPDSFFVTMQCCLLNTTTGELRYSNAGHMPPILLSNSGEVKELPCVPSVAVGIMDDFKFEQSTYSLQEGDTLYLYTDGVSEANNEQGNIFTTERLMSHLREQAQHGHTPKCLIENVSGAVASFRGNADQYDDITQLALRWRNK